MLDTNQSTGQSESSDSIGKLALLLASGLGGLGAIRVVRGMATKGQLGFLENIVSRIRQGDPTLTHVLEHFYPDVTIKPYPATAESYAAVGSRGLDRLLSNPRKSGLDMYIHPKLLTEEQEPNAILALYHEMNHPELKYMPDEILRRQALKGAETLPTDDLKAIHNWPADYSGRDLLEEIAARMAERDLAQQMNLPDLPMPSLRYYSRERAGSQMR